MFMAEVSNPLVSEQAVDAFVQEIEACWTDDWISNLANTSALIFEKVERINWAGFYLSVNGVSDECGLILGPFQGRIACVQIAKGKGVCGRAAELRDTVVVDDVHAFPGHIACDSRSQSEIVVPVLSEDRLLAVLDVDSPELARFGAFEKRLFESICLRLGRRGHRSVRN